MVSCCSQSAPQSLQHDSVYTIIWEAASELWKTSKKQPLTKTSYKAQFFEK